jgi:hypothetical protein
MEYNELAECNSMKTPRRAKNGRDGSMVRYPQPTDVFKNGKPSSLFQIKTKEGVSPWSCWREDKIASFW